MILDDLVILVPLIGYFLIIFIVHLLLPSPPLPLSNPISRRDSLFHLLAFLSLAITWYYMLSFMKASYLNYYIHNTPPVSIPSLALWLRNTSLFKEAWSIVCSTPGRWWWSSQLCTYTAGIWTVFLWNEAREKRIKRVWVYMLIGQIVAISYASALFFAAREATPTPPSPKKSTVYASKGLVWTTVTATIISFFLYESVSTPYFLAVLLIVHVLLFLPLVESPNARPSRITVSQLYAMNGLLAALVHWGNCYMTFKSGDLGFIFAVILEHPAMSSVGWDVICSTIIGVIGTGRIQSITLPLGVSLGGTMGGILSLFPLDEEVKEKGN